MKCFKYPRTYHVPWSKGTTSDDRILSSVKHFYNKEIIVSEKIDGESCSIYNDHIHARSIDSKHHESRNLVKALAAKIQHDIPAGYRICGENMAAKHSIHYLNLESYFYVFGIYDDKNICLSWNETVEWCNALELPTVPVLYRGVWDEEKVKACWTGVSTASPGDPQEGYVVRVSHAFPYEEQDKGLDSIYTVKMVREKHVQTSAHWLNEPMIPNKIRS